MLKARGMRANQQVTFLTGDGEDIRGIPCYFNAQAEQNTRRTDPLTMRVTVIADIARDPIRSRATGSIVASPGGGYRRRAGRRRRCPRGPGSTAAMLSVAYHATAPLPEC